MATAKIGKAVVDALKPGESVWDTETRGFGVRRQLRDATYVLKVRIGGRQRFLTIGKHGAPWTAEDARKQAKRLLGAIADNRDPATERDQRNATPTLAEFATRYVGDYAERYKRTRSVEEDRRNLRLHILPALGRNRITDVTSAMVAQFHSERSDHPTNANRCLALLSHMFSVASKWGVIPSNTNPCVGRRKFPEHNRERFLSRLEIGRLGEALEIARIGYPATVQGKPLPFKRKNPEDPRALALVRLLLFTGARLSEVLTLKWEWVDLTRGLARLPQSKTGAKNLIFPDPALEILAELPRIEGCPYVLWGDKPGQHFNGPQKAWQRIRALAGLEDVRLHDLRHAHASMAILNGESIYHVGKVLGHKQHKTTERYTHLEADPIHGTVGRTAVNLKAALDGTPKLQT